MAEPTDSVTVLQGQMTTLQSDIDTLEADIVTLASDLDTAEASVATQTTIINNRKIKGAGYSALARETS